jgi:hypothetical protein
LSYVIYLFDGLDDNSLYEGLASVLFVSLEKRGTVMINFGLSILSEPIRHKNPAPLLCMEVLDQKGNPLQEVSKVWKEKHLFNPLNTECLSSSSFHEQQQASLLNRKTSEKFEHDKTQNSQSESSSHQGSDTIISSSTPSLPSVSTMTTSTTTSTSMNLQTEKTATLTVSNESKQQEFTVDQKEHQNKSEAFNLSNSSRSHSQSNKEQQTLSSSPSYLFIARYNHLGIYKLPTLERVSRTEPKNPRTQFIWCGIMKTLSQNGNICKYFVSFSLLKFILIF